MLQGRRKRGEGHSDSTRCAAINQPWSRTMSHKHLGTLAHAGGRGLRLAFCERANTSQLIWKGFHYWSIIISLAQACTSVSAPANSRFDFGKLGMSISRMLCNTMHGPDSPKFAHLVCHFLPVFTLKALQELTYLDVNKYQIPSVATEVLSS